MSPTLRTPGTAAAEAVETTSFGPAARAVAVAFATIAAAIAPASGAEPVNPGTPTPARAKESDPRSATLALLERQLTLDTAAPLPLGELVTAMSSMTGVEISALWAGSRHPDGLPITLDTSLTVKNVTFRAALEKLATNLSREGIDATWQVLADGRLQFGTKESLNQYKELRIYEVQDMTIAMPMFTGAPEFNLNGALTQGRGGGGGSIIGEPGEEPRRSSAQSEAARLVEIIQETVEPEQWSELGGSGGTIRIYQNTLMVNAAPYLHRGISGR